MKNTFKIFGIVAAVAIIGLSMVACGDTIIHVPDPGPGPGPGDDERLTPLTLSGQVWRYSWRHNIRIQYNGNRTVFSDIGGSGAITDGQLSFSIGTPSRLESILNIFDEFHAQFYDFNISAPSASGAFLEPVTSGGGPVAELIRWYGDYEVVGYLFVDRNVTVTGRGRTTTDSHQIITTQDLNLNLRAGWNALHTRTENLGITDGVRNYRYAFSIGDPARMRWYLLLD